MLGKRWWAIAGVLALAALLGACGGGGDKDSSAGGGQGTSPGALGAVSGTAAATQQAAKPIRRGGTLIVAMDANPRGEQFDPMKSGDAYTSAVTSAVTEGLYSYNEKVEPVPWLAEKIDISPDGLTYTFHLRKGVMFHDNTEMDAEAVKFSIDRVRDEKNKQYPGYADSRRVADTQAVDKYTFKLVLSEANSAFPSRLTGRLGGVVSPTAVRTMGEEKFSTAPVGTGPFRFKEFKNDQYVRVEKNENYWRDGADGKKLPYVDAVEWRIITEPTGRLTALQAGDVHIAAIRDQDAKIVREDKNLNYAQQAGFSLTSFAFNIQAPPFNNKALRQAVNFALDREEIIRAVYEGNREVGHGFIPLTLQWAIDRDYKPYPFDQTRAKAKLAEGGRPDGFEFTAWLGSGNSVGKQLYELMQAQLAKVGIRMKVEEGDFNGVLVPKWQRNDADAGTFAISWSTGVDPDSLMTNLFTKDGSFNHNKYDNPRVTELVLAARKTSNLEERGRYYKEMMKLVMDDAPWCMIVYGIERHVGSKKVDGWYLGVKATTSYSEYWLNS